MLRLGKAYNNCPKISNQNIIYSQHYKNKFKSNITATTPHPSKQEGNIDSGTTGHYIALKDINCLVDVRPSTHEDTITVTLPTGEKIRSTHTGFLNLPSLQQEQRVHVFDSLWGSLISVGELADIGLTTIFTKYGAYVVDTDSEEVVLTGRRDPTTRLYMIALKPITEDENTHAINQALKSTQHPQQATHVINAASTQILDTAGDRVEFFSRVFCSAAESTLIKAVKKKWVVFPGITANILKRHRRRLRTHESAAGHLDQVHQNHQRHNGPSLPDPTTTDSGEKQATHIVTKIYTEGNHMDATGRLPFVSHQGHQYILILYSEGGNFIKAVPMKDRTKQSYLTAHKTAYKYFDDRGYAPTFQRLDNEVSNEFITYLQDNRITIDLVPPHQHRRNKAERAIRTFKNHFIAMLAGVDPSFPMHAWNQLLEQAEITVNMLRPSHHHPRISAWEALNGKYDFDAHPMAPPGTAITIHEKPDQRGSWSKHGIQGFYLGPAMATYRCYRVWTKHKESTRISDTIAWHPHGYAWEQHSPLDIIGTSADILVQAINQLPTTQDTQQPLSTISTELQTQFKALQRLYAPQAPAANPTGEAQDEQRPTSAPIQRVPTPHIALPNSRVPDPVNAPTQTSTRRRPRQCHHNSTYKINQAQQQQDDEINEAIALATANNRPRHGPSPYLHRELYVNSVIAQAHRRLITKHTKWSHWKKLPGVNFDSQGIPFFDQSSPLKHFANTATDLDAAGKKLSWATALASPEGDIWLAKHGEEISRLFDSDTIKLIFRHDLPAGAKPAYYNPQVRTKIKDGVLLYRVRGTIGGDKINYAGDTAAHTASMTLIKVLLNTIVSEPDAKFMTADIKDFYLGTPLPTTEYMTIKLDHIPSDVIAKYDMAKYASNGAVTVSVHKGIYGLPQAGKLAQDRLITHLAANGYHLAPHTPCLFKHESRNIAFTLVVDDFGIKYTKAEDADHLLHVLRQLYTMTEDRSHIQKYVGITINHDRDKHCMQLSMPGYCDKAIQRFGHAKRRGAKSPIIYVPPEFGNTKATIMPIKPPKAPEYVDQAAKTFVQEVTGVFLFYSRAVDPTMLAAVNKISMEQSKPTTDTLKAVDRLLSYAEQYPNAVTTIRRSNMILCVQSDASYHSESQARSRAGGILHFGCNADDGSINGAIDHISMVIPTVCSSAAESEYAALFLNCREATNVRTILHDLGLPQPTTEIICDNKCAVGIAHDDVKLKRSKAMDMRYHWIRDQVRQGKFKVTWQAGNTNLADYHTKAHPVHHFVTMRRTFVHTPKPDTIKTCARSRRIETKKLKP